MTKSTRGQVATVVAGKAGTRLAKLETGDGCIKWMQVDEQYPLTLTFDIVPAITQYSGSRLTFITRKYEYIEERIGEEGRTYLYYREVAE
jgi:hypothetical protein